MLGSANLIRRDERREVSVAFVYLVGLVGSYAALETARDALFLARIPNTRLPLMYMSVAIASFFAQKARSLLPFRSRYHELAGTTAISGLGTLAIALSLPRLGDAGLYVLYVWSGVATTLALLSFWSLLGDTFTASQAKRVYGVISLGSAIGSIMGTAGVTATTSWIAPKAVVFTSGLGFFLTALIVPFFRSRVARSSAEPKPEARLVARISAGFGYVTRGPYVWRLVGIAMLGSVAVTLADFVFKSTLVASVPATELASAFGRTYLFLNVLSLGVQLLAVSVLLRRLSPSSVVAILPCLLAFSGVGMLVGAGLVGAVLLKSVDGALRYSTYKTGFELLYIPLPDEGRRRVKVAVELVGQRGGQIVASSAILLFDALAWDALAPWTLVACALVWAGLSFKLHAYYVEQFRASVVGDGAAPAGLASLDVASLETLIASLDSERSVDVLAALAILRRERKLRLVPGLILFHPEPAVVVAALRAFVEEQRVIPRHALGHLLRHPSPGVRAELWALDAAFALDPRESSEALAIERSPEVRAALITKEILAQSVDEEDGRKGIEELVAASDVAGRVVVAEIVGKKRAAPLLPVVARLLVDPSETVRVAAAESLAAIGTVEAARVLVDRLADVLDGVPVRRALSRFPKNALVALDEALFDKSHTPAVRWVVPQAMAQVDPKHAATALLRCLRDERDGMVRYRALVALTGVIEADPTLPVDRARALEELGVDVARAYRYLDRVVVLEAAADAAPSRRTEGRALLLDLLRDRQENAIGRVFRLLAVLFPQHRFTTIYRAIESGERVHRAGAVELTNNLLTSPLREAVVALVDDLEPEARLAGAGPYHQKLRNDDVALLRELLASRSAVVRDAAAFHMGELSEENFLADLESLAAAPDASGDVLRAMEILSGARSVGERPRFDAPEPGNVG